MLDVAKQLNSTLSSVLPTCYEQFLDDEVEIPCITYIEHSNYDYKTSEHMGYSYVTYLVKVFANDYASLQKYSQQVDKALRNIGYERLSALDVVTDNQLQKWLTYRGLGVEFYEET